MKTIVRKLTVTGMDWHDSRTVTSYLEENGSWFVSSPVPLIAADIHKELSGMGQDSEKDGKTESIMLQHIPSLERVTGFVKCRKPFTVRSGDALSSELEAEWCPDENILYMYYAYGQVSTAIQFLVEDIPEEKLCFIPVETFYAPMKGVSSVQRIRARLYSHDEEAGARQAMSDIQGSLWGTDTPFGSAAEMIIDNRDALENGSSEWYGINRKAFLLREQHPEIEGYRLFAADDVQYLENEIKKEELR